MCVCVCVCVCVSLNVLLCGCVISMAWLRSNCISLTVSSRCSICTQTPSLPCSSTLLKGRFTQIPQKHIFPLSRSVIETCGEVWFYVSRFSDICLLFVCFHPSIFFVELTALVPLWSKMKDAEARQCIKYRHSWSTKNESCSPWKSTHFFAVLWAANFSELQICHIVYMKFDVYFLDLELQHS